jgi:hypothetical protein
MALDFLNSLQVEEQPLMSLSEAENSSSSESTNTDNNADDSNKTADTSSNDTEGDKSGLVPITDLDNSTDESSSSTTSTESSTDKPKETSDSSSKASAKKYAAIIKAMQEKTGGFEDFNEEEFEDTPEAFLEYLDTYATKNAEQLAEDYIQNNLTPLQQKFVNLMESGLSEEAASSIVKGYKLSENITEDALIENPDKAKNLYAEYLRYTTAFSEDRIKKEVDKKEEVGSLVDDALEIIPEFQDILTNAEKQEKDKLLQKEKATQEFYAKQAKELQDYLETTEEIGGIKLTKKMKDNWMKEYSLVQTQDGKKVNPILATREVDPNKFDALLRLYHTMGLFKYDSRKKDFVPDFSAISSLGKNEAIKQLEKAVQNDNIRRKTSGYSSSDSIEFDEEKEDHLKKWAALSKKYANSQD